MSRSERARRLVEDLFTPLGEPFAEPEVLLVALRVHVLFAPVVLGPTAWMYATSPDFASTALQAAIWGWWMPAAAAFVLLAALGSALGLAERGSTRLRVQRALWLAALVPMLTTNHVTGWMFGTLTNPSAAIFIAFIAAYRVFLDYASALAVACISLAGFVGLALLEVNGIVPTQPFLETHPNYAVPQVTQVMLVGAVVMISLVFCTTNYGMNQRTRLHHYITRSVLRRYLPESLVERASRGAFDVDGPPERREVTVMFTDLVGFTALSEELGPEAVGRVLDRYLATIANLAHKHGATVDKFIGDAVMVVIGAPEELPAKEQVRRAVALAEDIHRTVQQLPSSVALIARTGLNTGEAVVGNFGSEVRSDYTVIGPAVNVAARLESASRPGRVLLGPRSAELFDGELEDAGEFTLKGVSQPIRAFFLP
ncbi:MAG: adenylate/guanylate cyclase domain-containing protein [Deltaproteobacteria bacterium]|nr:MAG: adenylate/guanylate cyclase domain-containing protein [Deltaproteobacteria bacterium]